MATAEELRGKQEHVIFHKTMELNGVFAGHHSSAMVRRYIREAELFSEETAVARLL